MFAQPIFWFYLIALIVWAHRAKRALVTLKNAPVVLPATPPFPFGGSPTFVSILVPAKNEESNIIQCVQSLLDQDYPNYEIIVVNDNSTDTTEELLQSLGALCINEGASSDAAQARLRYLNCAPTPTGWTGKNFALHQAVSQARGEWYLFTDADTRHHPISLSASVTHAVSRNLTFLTLLPRCIAESFFEKLIQPAAMGLMGLWFPIEKVNDLQHPLHFANGQYMLIHRRLYQDIGGHEQVRTAFLEDFALMKNAKIKRAPVECALGTAVYGTRMYDSLPAIVRGWKRIYLHAFDRNTGRLLSRAASVLLFTVFPWLLASYLVGLVFQYPGVYTVPAYLCACTLVIMLFTAWKTYDIVKADRMYSLLHPVAGLFVAIFLLDAAKAAALKHSTVWR